MEDCIPFARPGDISYPEAIEAVHFVGRAIDRLAESFSDVGNEALSERLCFYSKQLRFAAAAITHHRQAAADQALAFSKETADALTAAVVAGCIRPAESK